MNGEVDVSGRALIVLSIRPSHGADAVSLQAWVDTAFTGELVIPQATITLESCRLRSFLCVAIHVWSILVGFGFRGGRRRGATVVSVVAAKH
jgi:predicted aspartyl protease